MTTKKFQTLCEEILFPHFDDRIGAECQKLEDMLAVMGQAIGRLDAFVEDRRLEEFQIDEESA